LQAATVEIVSPAERHDPALSNEAVQFERGKVEPFNFFQQSTLFAAVNSAR